MKYQCTKCNRTNYLASDQRGSDYLCHHCETPLPDMPMESGENSALVGMIGGAALGAAVGGPFGAVVGAMIGNVAGKNAKGLG